MKVHLKERDPPATSSNHLKLLLPRESNKENLLLSEAVARRYSVKKVLRNFAKITGKHLCQSLFFNKVAGLRLAALLKKRLLRSRFHVIFAKFLRVPFFTEHLRWLLLHFMKILIPVMPTPNSRLCLPFFRKAKINLVVVL